MLKRAQALFLGLLSPVIALAMAGNVSAESDAAAQYASGSDRS